MSGRARDDDRHVIGKLEEDLPAGATGCRRRLAGDQSNRDGSSTGGNGGRHGVALGADREGIRGILDVASSEDATVISEHCGAYTILRVRRVGVGADTTSCFNEAVNNQWGEFHALTILAGEPTNKP